MRAWICRQTNFEPLIAPAQEKPLALFFINLVEAYVLASIRRECRLSMNKIRKGLDFISQIYPSDNPLAEKGFETDGLSPFLRESGLVCGIFKGSGQTVLENTVKEYMQRIERDLRGLPIRLYPFSGTEKPNEPKSILIDPEISFGRPILSGISIPVEIIVERYKAGESMRELAGDYECSQKKSRKLSDVYYGNKPPEPVTEISACQLDLSLPHEEKKAYSLQSSRSKPAMCLNSRVLSVIRMVPSPGSRPVRAHS